MDFNKDTLEKPHRNRLEMTEDSEIGIKTRPSENEPANASVEHRFGTNYT